MTMTSDQLKTVIIELGALEKPILDTEIMKLACLGAEKEIEPVWGTPSLKIPQNTSFFKQHRMAPRLTLISRP